MKIDLNHLMNEADAYAYDAYREIGGNMPIVSVLTIDEPDAETFNVFTFPAVHGTGFVVAVAHAISYATQPHAIVVLFQATSREYRPDDKVAALFMEMQQDNRIKGEDDIAKILGRPAVEKTQAVITGEDKTGQRLVRIYDVVPNTREGAPEGSRTMVPVEQVWERSVNPFFPMLDDSAERFRECHELIHTPEWLTLPMRLHQGLNPEAEQRQVPLVLPLDR